MYIALSQVCLHHKFINVMPEMGSFRIHTVVSDLENICVLTSQLRRLVP